MNRQPKHKNQFDKMDCTAFLNFTGLFEGGLAGLALLLAFIFGIDLLGFIRWSWPAVRAGILATIPLFVVLTITANIRFKPFDDINDMMLDTVGKHFSQAYWWELLLIAMMAGVCEELLFRGFLQVWIEELLGYTAGLVISNIVFGLMHAVTAVYAVLIAIVGLYFGWIFDITGERNLVVPMVTHTIYDFVAFFVIIHSYRKREESRSPD